MPDIEEQALDDTDIESMESRAFDTAQPPSARTIVRPVPFRQEGDLAALGVPPGALAYAKRIGVGEIDMEVLAPDPAVRGQVAPPGIGDRVALELFAGERFEMEWRRIEDGFDDARTWIGAVMAPRPGFATLTVAGDRIFGTVETGRQRYTVQSGRDGLVFAREIDARQIPGCGLTPELVQRDAAEVAASAEHRAPSLPAPEVSPGRTMDLMVLYSPAVATNQGGNPSALINNLVANLNQSFIDSGIDAAVRVVYQAQLDGVTDPSTANQFLTTRTNLRSGAAPFANVAALRTQHGADLVTLLVQNPANSEVCGIAYIMGANSTAEADVSPFAVIGVNCAASDHTFTHELGHTLSGRHDWGPSSPACSIAQPSTWPSCGVDNTDNQPFTFNHGFTNFAGNFRTIMGSRFIDLADPQPDNLCNRDADGCPRLNRWSSPTQTIMLNGQPFALGTGTPATDMVQAINTTTPTVVQYRTPPVSPPGVPPSHTREPVSCFRTWEVTWAEASGTVSWYEFYTSASSTFTSQVLRYKGLSRRVTFTVPSGTTYYTRVRACNGAGCGGYRDTGAAAGNGGCP